MFYPGNLYHPSDYPSMIGPTFNQFAFAAVALVVFVGGLLAPDGEPATETEFYCQMVDINKADDSIGWPDYKGIYDEVCSNSPPNQ